MHLTGLLRRKQEQGEDFKINKKDYDKYNTIKNSFNDKYEDEDEDEDKYRKYPCIKQICDIVDENIKKYPNAHSSEIDETLYLNI